MDADLDTLATARYVTTDDLLNAHPERFLWRPAVGIQPRVTDAEIITLAVMQALLSFTSEARVRAAPPGTCNDTLNRAAFNLGQLVAAGLLDPERVRGVLLAAALAAPATGHTDRQRKAKATINSGLRGGAAKPRRRRGGAA